MSLASKEVSFPFLIQPKAKMTWVQRNGSMYSGRNFPILGLYWDQLV